MILGLGGHLGPMHAALGSWHDEGRPGAAEMRGWEGFPRRRIGNSPVSWPAVLRQLGGMMLALGLAAVPAGLAQVPAPAAEVLTAAEQAQFAELERDFARLDAFLASLPPSQPRDETRRVLEEMRSRATELRGSFDQTRFDEIRWEVNFEHQQMQLWLQEPRLVPLDSEVPVVPHNTLSAREKASGWELLFDGRSLAGWRGFRGTGIPPGRWKAENGMIHALPTKRTPGDRLGDLITERKFDNFEFSWEWRIAPKANNGVKYLVTEERPNTPGPEYQMVDDFGSSGEAVGPLHQTASFYEVLPPAIDSPRRPAGKWNQSRILVKGTRVEHWLNGRKVLSFDLTSPEVKAGLAASKFKDEPGFGEKIVGHLMLTYHGDECWFRNLKVRQLR